MQKCVGNSEIAWKKCESWENWSKKEVFRTI